ncbi:MAG: GFA family protein [Panacagrimonas sp.]
MSLHTGSCLCGAVRYEIQGELEPIQIRHCVQCRKAQGTAFVTNIPVHADRFRLLSGAERLTEFESSPGKLRVFCNICGSPVLSRRVADPGTVRIRAGTLDEALSTRAIAHFHVASKANWWTISDALPQFKEGYVAPGARPG